jgi:Tetratricopeptide repeat
MNKLLVSTLMIIGLAFSTENSIANQLSDQILISQNTISDKPNEAESRRRSRLFSTARNLEYRLDYNTALTLYEELYGLDSTRREYSDGIIRNMILLARFEDAELFIKSIIPTLPNQKRSHYYSELGVVYSLAGFDNERDAAWKLAIDVNPKSTNSYQSLANSQMKVRSYDKAIETYLLGRENLNQPSLFSINLASIYRSRMNWDGASKEYILTLKSGPQRENYVRRGLASFPNDTSADSILVHHITNEIETLENPPWDLYELALHRIIADQHRKNGRYVRAFEQIVVMDQLNGDSGKLLIQFASEAMIEGFSEIADNALDIAAGKMRDGEGKDTIKLAKAEIAYRTQEYTSSDSLLSEVIKKPASKDLEIHALIKRGSLRLEELNKPELAIRDFEYLLNEKGFADKSQAHYKSAVALIQLDSLDKASGHLKLIREHRASELQLQIQLPLPRKSYLNQGIFLQSRIALWQNSSEDANHLLDSLLFRPYGEEIENDALMLLHMITTAQNEEQIKLFAQADRAEFKSDVQTAMSYYDSSSNVQNPNESMKIETEFRSLMLKYRVSENDENFLIGFLEKYADHPRVEEVWYALGKHYEAREMFTEAVGSYEQLLIKCPDAYLAEKTRQLIDEILLRGDAGS